TTRRSVSATIRCPRRWPASCSTRRSSSRRCATGPAPTRGVPAGRGVGGGGRGGGGGAGRAVERSRLGARGSLRRVGRGRRLVRRRARRAEAAAVGDRLPEHAPGRRRAGARGADTGMSERVVGIDLGTTNSLVAVLDDAGPPVLPDPDTGVRLLKSAVAFLPGNEVRVGEAARALGGERAFDP